MIEVLNIGKSYGDFTAVSSVSFSARKGDILGFLGPNGAGKTTTLRMLVTYMAPTHGTARMAGFDIITQANEVRKNIGYLPETPPLYPEMSVREYLEFVAQIKGIPRRGGDGFNIGERVRYVLETCFLTDVQHKLCGHLSRGFRQRVGIAQAIIHNPAVIILDEPTSGLDPKQIIEIRRSIASLAKDHTVILSTHILPEVSMVCNKVVIINQGRVALEQYLDDMVKEKTLEQVFMECVGAEQVAHAG